MQAVEPKASKLTLQELEYCCDVPARNQEFIASKRYTKTFKKDYIVYSVAAVALAFYAAFVKGSPRIAYTLGAVAIIQLALSYKAVNKLSFKYLKKRELYIQTRDKIVLFWQSLLETPTQEDIDLLTITVKTRKILPYDVKLLDPKFQDIFIPFREAVIQLASDSMHMLLNNHLNTHLDIASDSMDMLLNNHLDTHLDNRITTLLSTLSSDQRQTINCLRHICENILIINNQIVAIQNEKALHLSYSMVFLLIGGILAYETYTKLGRYLPDNKFIAYIVCIITTAVLAYRYIINKELSLEEPCIDDMFKKANDDLQRAWETKSKVLTATFLAKKGVENIDDLEKAKQDIQQLSTAYDSPHSQELFVIEPTDQESTNFWRFIHARMVERVKNVSTIDTTHLDLRVLTLFTKFKANALRLVHGKAQENTEKTYVQLKLSETDGKQDIIAEPWID